MSEPTARPHRRPAIVGEAPAAPPRQYLPTADDLERLWEEVAAKPRFGGGLWRHLALRRRLSLRLVDAPQIRITAPAFKINDCAGCTDICCVGPRSTVLLRLRDIATLVDLGREELISQHKPAFSATELAARPALRRQVGSSGWEAFPVLKQDSMGACEALTLEGRCSLYPNWPLACARFPYALHSNVREAFYSQRCDSYWIRPDAAVPVNEMVEAAVTAYNERIKDLVLLEYASDRLAELGLLKYLRLA